MLKPTYINVKPNTEIFQFPVNTMDVNDYSSMPTVENLFSQNINAILDFFYEMETLNES